MGTVEIVCIVIKVCLVLGWAWIMANHYRRK